MISEERVRDGDCADELRARIDGSVVVPGDEAYDTSRQGWNLAVQQEPAVIVFVASVEDVQEAIRFAKQNGLPVGVQTTGHGLPRACNGGLLINMRNMKGVAIDLATRTAKIGGGCQWADVIPAAVGAGLAPLSGSAPHVGVVGYTLGGGYSLMGRKYGLAIDSVRGFTLVTPEAEVLEVTATENSDLFWAVRGGGGAFGVITEIEMELYPQPEIFGGSILYPIDRAGEILQKYLEWTKSVPDDVSATFQLMHFPPVPFVPEFLHNQSVVMIIGSVTTPEAEAIELMRPMREFGGHLMDSFTTMSYAETGAVYRDPVDPLPAAGGGVLLKSLSPESAETLLSSIGEMSKSPNLMIQLRHLGGAMKSCATDSASSRRDAEYLIYMLGVPHLLAAPEEIHGQSERVFAALGDAVLCRGPLNFLGEGNVGAGEIKDVFTEESWSRLSAIKRQFDPENRFAYAGIGIRD